MKCIKDFWRILFPYCFQLFVKGKIGIFNLMLFPLSREGGEREPRMKNPFVTAREPSSLVPHSLLYDYRERNHF